MASPCEIKHSKTTTQLDYLTLHQDPKATIELTMHASFQFIQGTGEYRMVPMVHPTFTSSHPIKGSMEQLAIACIANIFCNDFVPSVRNHWFQWDTVDLPASMNRRLALDARINADSANDSVPFLFPVPLTSTPSTSICQQAFSPGNSDSDFSYLANTSYVLHSDDDPGLLTMNTDSKQEVSDDMTLHLLSSNITLRCGQRYTPEPRLPSCLKPMESVRSMDCPPFCASPQSRSSPLVGPEGVNEKNPTTAATNTRPKGHVNDSFMPSAVLHMPRFKESTAGKQAMNKGHPMSWANSVASTVLQTDQNSNNSSMLASAARPSGFTEAVEERSPVKGMNTNSKGHSDDSFTHAAAPRRTDDSFTSSTISYPSVSAKVMQKQSSRKDANANLKGRTDDLSIPSALPRAPVFKLATGHIASRVQSSPSGQPSQASVRREDPVFASQSIKDDVAGSPVRHKRSKAIPLDNVPCAPTSLPTQSRGKFVAASGPKRQAGSKHHHGKLQADPVPMHVSTHAHENGVMVTNNFYLMTSDPLTASNGQRDAGTEHITADIHKIIQGGYIHPTTVDEIWKCIYQLSGYEPSSWRAVLTKCGVEEMYWPQLLWVMKMASHEHRKVDSILRMARVSTINGKRVRAKLTPSQKADRHEKYTSLMKDLERAKSAYAREAEELVGKHGQSLKWTKTQLFLTTRLRDRRRVNSWNGFLKAKLREANAGHEVGHRLRLTDFIAQNRQELLAAYSLLTIDQKQAYNNAIVAARTAAVPTARLNPKSVSQVVSSAFSKMDQQWTGLCAQTGLEGFYIAVHGTVEDLSEPKVFFTERVEKFVRNVLGIEPCHLALHLESWVVSGIGSFIFPLAPREAVIKSLHY
ncbi:hypothetical protein PISMIDRAFT_15884 [Pisolithus microcarpus 441]|uniref:Uncharacterized protein n=1 Tax=Pisolithus microcarpus 441 TaxID=765257 RepID=A0A0C9Z8W4_9AGAM|nr:hypothetical protein PISMIDRAFT_15884 [Pisolithus microcarpus 441]